MDHLDLRAVRGLTAVAVIVAAGLVAPAVAQAADTATVVGTVTGPNGEPLAGVTVNGSGLGDGAVTTAQGRYRITGIVPDATVVPCAFPPPDYRGGTAPAGYLPACGSGTTSADRTTRVDLRLALGAGMSGRVLDDRTGRPVPGATIRTQSRLPGPGLAGPEVVTAADGTWSVRGLDPDENAWTACVEGPARTADAPFGYGGPARQRCSRLLTLAAGRSVVVGAVRLAPSARITGTVTGPGDLRRVVVSTDSGSWSTRRDGGGYTADPVARYGSGPVDGPVCAQGSATYDDPRGLAIQCGVAAYSVSTVSRLDFAMAVGAGLRGTITGATDATSVWVVWQGRRLFGTILDDTGRYWISALPTGSYVVQAVTGTGTPVRSARVQLTQGSVVDGVDLALR